MEADEVSLSFASTSAPARWVISVLDSNSTLRRREFPLAIIEKLQKAAEMLAMGISR